VEVPSIFATIVGRRIDGIMCESSELLWILASKHELHQGLWDGYNAAAVLYHRAAVVWREQL
jgi:hypothetical protein